jgi:hypothetical protein
MKKRSTHLPRDLKALSYLDALDAGDIEAVAELWEEAGFDPELERVLAELDGALFEEMLAKPGATREMLRRRYRRSAILAGVIGVSAAACLVAVLAWPTSDIQNSKPSIQITSGKNGDRTPKTNVSSPFLSDGSARTNAWLETRHVLDGVEQPAPPWPLQESSPLGARKSIPADLLN